MKIGDMKLRDALELLHGQLRELLVHPDVTAQDKASIVNASTDLSEIGRRHMSRWTPVNPATLPPRKAGQTYAEVPDWRRDWENEKEVANA